jgi:hypothetical protein
MRRSGMNIDLKLNLISLTISPDAFDSQTKIEREDFLSHYFTSSTKPDFSKKHNESQGRKSGETVRTMSYALRVNRYC